MITTIPMAATVGLPNLLSIKNDGTPMSAAILKHMSCLLVMLNITLLFTLVKSLGTDIYDAASLIPFFREH